MATRETLIKAIEAVQKHIDTVIHVYGTTGVPVKIGDQHPDYDPIIKAFTVRELLLKEKAGLPSSR
jgi:2-phospho-L-lactate transferase/gluconeogenesis factor (CofD/UPF0052 family)